MKLTNQQLTAALYVAKHNVTKEYEVDPSILRFIEEGGYVTKSKGEKVGRGRKPYVYTLTGKGKAILNLAKSWSKTWNAAKEA